MICQRSFRKVLVHPEIDGRLQPGLSLCVLSLRQTIKSKIEQIRDKPYSGKYLVRELSGYYI